MGELHETCRSKKKFQRGMNRLDRESMALMANAKKKCRKI
jgi:hypothetical protein